MLRTTLRILTALLIALIASAVHAYCTSPTGVEGEIHYDPTNHILEYCNGTSWINTGGGAASGSTGNVQFNASGAFASLPSTVICSGTTPTSVLASVRRARYEFWMLRMVSWRQAMVQCA